jgi:hypothetical protein
MSTITVADIPLAAGSPAERLRRTAAAVRVHFTWWGVHRTLTDEQKEEVGDTYGADARFLTAGKTIIDVRHQAYRKLSSLRRRIVKYWRRLTLPYVEPGKRLLRQADIESFIHTMEDFRAEMTKGEADLNAVYEQIKDHARQGLKRLFNPDDYPSTIRGLFAVDWDFPSVDPPSYLLEISPDVYRQEEERVARRFEQAIELAEQAFIGEFAKLLSHLTERLSGGADSERKIFRDSVITNLTDFFGRFRQLNVRSNAQLDGLVTQAQQLVHGIEPQALRDNSDLRQHVAMQLSGVQSVLDGMLVDRPRRRIIRAQPSTNGETHATGD